MDGCVCVCVWQTSDIQVSHIQYVIDKHNQQTSVSGDKTASQNYNNPSDSLCKPLWTYILIDLKVSPSNVINDGT